jgi:hypothetical protein
MEDDQICPSEGDDLQGSLHPHCSPPIALRADLNSYNPLKRNQVR